MKSLMRSCVFWSDIDKDIEKIIRNCRGCFSDSKVTPIKSNSWSKADTPWSRLYIDFTGTLNGSYYLVVVDSFTKWPEILKRRKATSRVTINFLRELFDEIISDNVNQFTRSEFRRFCEVFTIKYNTTTTYYLRSNGHAERFIDIFKRALKNLEVCIMRRKWYSNSCEWVGWHLIEVLRRTANLMFAGKISCYQYEKSATICRTIKPRHLMLDTRYFLSRIGRVTVFGWMVLLGTKRNCLPFLRFMSGASDNHVTFSHVTVWEASSTTLFDQEGPRDRTSTSASAMWEARAYKSPYDNSHYTRPT